ncbi:MAG: phosphoglycerate mutase (2,3-diphosphoglycerate-independent) [Phycisphaeraceae bacterium TMED231]|nr:MAG: phosphoglycerate mutase (2,3-diphosphoglycerate-independent) [Phycisphaeraceae bacterium TMED231]
MPPKTETPSSSRPPAVLVIRDGWGTNPRPGEVDFDAVRKANTPIADDLEANWPTTLVRTSGEDVGLPIGVDGPVMGNSEVGHQNIGAGRIVDQELMRITRSIRSGEFFENAALLDAFAHATETGGRVHLLGLVSDGLVHSDLGHLVALLDAAKRRGFPGDRVLIHAITDGRDTPPTGGVDYLAELQRGIESHGAGRVVSVMGRFYAMDRDHRWERVEAAYRCLTERSGPRHDTPAAAAEAYYADPSEASRHGDEFVTPSQIGVDDADVVESRIRDGDSIVFFNFRGDRPREITKAFTLEDEAWAGVERGGFDRGERLRNLRFTAMTRYEAGLPVEVMFEKPPRMEGILGAAVSDAGLTQFRCAETEKFPHVTFFFNDYREEPFPGERRVIVPSPTDVTTYDQKPEMSADGVTEAVLERLAADDCERLLVVNFANGDMVGHTGSMEAAIAACEKVDACVGRIIETTLARGGALIITADHGNAEQMWNFEADCPQTAHTNFDVPLHVVGDAWRDASLPDDGRLADIAPTLLAMLGIPRPDAMTGRNLLD